MCVSNCEADALFVWLRSVLNKISIYIQRPVEHTKYIDVSVRSNQIGDSIMTVEQNPDLFFGAFVSMTSSWKLL